MSQMPHAPSSRPIGPFRPRRETTLILHLCLCLAFISYAVRAADEKLPALRPPRGEIYPTFWEQHGWLVLIFSLLAVLAITALVILLNRPKRNWTEPPEVLARRALAALRDRAEDGALITEVSRIFRRYAIFAFSLLPQELTTTELNQTLRSLPKPDPALVSAIADFLRQCDEEKFAPRVVPPRVNAVARALELLEKIEAHRLQSFVKEPAA